jgi:hypothetical protein
MSTKIVNPSINQLLYMYSNITSLTVNSDEQLYGLTIEVV